MNWRTLLRELAIAAERAGISKTYHKHRRTLLRALAIAGLAGMLLGAIDPMEGCVVILWGAMVAALGALLGRAKLRKLMYVALTLVALGVAAMFVLTWFGGVGGRSGHSIWWALTVVPYPIGWILGLIGVVAMIREFFKGPAQTTAA